VLGVVAVTTLCVLVAVGLVRLGGDGGPRSAEAVVALYADALRRGDAAAVAELTADERGSAVAAVARVVRLGGRGIGPLTATYHAEIGADQRDVDLRGVLADGTPFADRIVVERERPGTLRRLVGVDDRWVLRLVGGAADVV
jgi:hypothetical protein